MARAPKPVSPECPRCGYDVSGTMSTWTNECPLEGKCSECGYGFQWKHLVGPNLGVPKWFFETARRRLIRSAISTSVRTLMPWKFWKQVPLHAPVSGSRLAWLLANALLFVYEASVAMFALPLIIEVFDRNAFSPWQAPSGIAVRELFLGPQPLADRLRYLIDVDLPRAVRWPLEVELPPAFFATALLALICAVASILLPLGYVAVRPFIPAPPIRIRPLLRACTYAVSVTAIGLGCWYLAFGVDFLVSWVLPFSSTPSSLQSLREQVLVYWWMIWPAFMCFWWWTAFRFHFNSQYAARIAVVLYLAGLSVACAVVICMPGGIQTWLRILEW